MKLDLRPLLAGDRLLTFDYELPLDIDSEDTSSYLYGVTLPSVGIILVLQPAIKVFVAVSIIQSPLL